MRALTPSLKQHVVSHVASRREAVGLGGGDWWREERKQRSGGVAVSSGSSNRHDWVPGGAQFTRCTFCSDYRTVDGLLYHNEVPGT